MFETGSGGRNCVGAIPDFPYALEDEFAAIIDDRVLLLLLFDIVRVFVFVGATVSLLLLLPLLPLQVLLRLLLLFFNAAVSAFAASCLKLFYGNYELSTVRCSF